MRRLASVTCGAAGTLLLAGCGHAHTRGAERGPVTIVGTAGNSDWKAVIQDFYANGRVDQGWSCGTLRAAVAHLPTDAPEVGWRIRVAARRAC